jgi:hypothetical protein
MRARETYVMRGGRLVPKSAAAPRAAAAAGPQIISDLAPYRSAAIDIATGRRALIGGRAQHREFLRRNNYVEVGNELMAPRRAELNRSERIADIRRALGD